MVFSFPYVCLKNSLGKHFWTFVICKKSNWTKGILPAVRNKHQIPSETRSTRIAYVYLWFPQFRVASLGSLCPSQFGGNLYYVLLQTWKPKLSGVVTILCSVHLTHQGFFQLLFYHLTFHTIILALHQSLFSETQKELGMTSATATDAEHN